MNNIKLTRNTKLYTAKFNNETITYRSLTVAELKIIDNIQNQVNKAEVAFKLGYISGPTPNFLIMNEIGRDIIDASTYITG